MEYFKTITQEDLVTLIEDTKKSLFLCLPSLHEELENALGFLDHTSHHNNFEVAIQILIDFDGQTFRQGYGNYTTVDKLIKDDYNLKTLKDNRISFIISDDIGYYLFVESRSLIPAEKETINAVRIDPVSLVRLKHYFFPGTDHKDIEDELTNAIIEESKLLENSKAILRQNKAKVADISEELRNLVEKDLKQNPAMHPDHKRLVEFYSNKFQYVKLKFEGSRLQYKRIELPPNALPIKDAALIQRLKTRLDLFDKETSKAQLSALEDFKKQVSDVRTLFLTKVKSRDESLLAKKHRIEFDESIGKLRSSMEATKSKILLSINNLIQETKQKVLAELRDFLIENPTAMFHGTDSPWLKDKAYIEQMAKSESEQTIQSIWPKAHELLDNFNLDVQYSDITLEDLKNEEFVKELHRAKLINHADMNELTEFSKGLKLLYNHQ